MANAIQFETPENVLVTYEPAGLGTRFVGWIVDQILIVFVNVVLFVAFVVLAAMGVAVIDRFLERWAGSSAEETMYYLAGVGIVFYNLGSFVYFTLSELFLRGQTVGKRAAGVRVVKANGFQLDAVSILVRNLFRVLDHLPPLWIVPLLTEKSQRLGDLVAGTVVVADKPEQLGEQGALRERLLRIPPQQGTWRFDASQLRLVRPVDFHAIERLLVRWGDVEAMERERLAAHVAHALAMRLDVARPPAGYSRQFLEELLAAEYRRQYRQLG